MQESTLSSHSSDLLPDYLLTDAAAHAYVLPSRAVVASAQDAWLVQPRRAYSIFTELLQLAAETQGWMAASEPRSHVRPSVTNAPGRVL